MKTGNVGLNRHELSDIPLNFLVASEKRKNLLLLLRHGPRTLREIRDSLGVSSSGIIPDIRKMEEKYLIYRTERKYSMTEVGNVLAEYIYQFEGILRIFGKNPEYWHEHRISSIPYEFRLRLYELGNYEIFRSNLTDVFLHQEEYMKDLLKARWIKGVTPVMYPEYLENVLGLANKGIDVSIVVPEELAGRIREKYMPELENCLNHEKPCIMVCNEKIGIDLSVTDFFLSMKLFLKDGTYDFNQIIVSLDKSALNWGKDMFSFYERRSRRVDLAQEVH